MVRQQERNRGVVLLVVVSLLVLFVLIAVTFAIVAGQYKHAAQATAKFQVVGDPPQKELDKIAYTLLRDTTERSVLQGHSFLNDLYGKDATGGVVTGAVARGGGQFLLLTVSLMNPSNQPGFYNGNVFTFTSGAAKGYSTRIVGYSPPSTIQIEAVDGDGTAIPLPSSGDAFGINGKIFNGTGFGYESASATSATGAPGIVLRTASPPNTTHALDLVATQPVFAHYNTTPNIQPDQFGADEAWDAPDNNNLIIAMVPSNAATSSEIMPSFHRQDLIAYWFRWLGQPSNPLASLSSPLERQIVFAMPYGPDNIRNNADEGAAPWSNVSIGNRDAIVALKRKIIFRPLPEDHPQFTGSNPSTTPIFGMASSGQTFNILTGTVPILPPPPPTTLLSFLSPDSDNNNALDLWDVDNDGDGIPDSIWLDPGLPVVTAPDGRQYKRLVAILCRDMDGRININAASALAHISPNANSPNYESDIIGPLAGTPSTNLKLPRGLGFGVADLNLRHLFGNSATGNTEYAQLLQARYGADLQPGAAATDDLLSAAKSIGIPNNYTTGPAAYGSPPDLSGQGAIALDYNGQPLTGYMGNNGETVDDPYESDPLQNRPQDAMYTVADLERLLRSADPDAPLLSPRLLNVAPNVLGNRTNQRRVTTHSVHIPQPNVTMPFELRSNPSYGFAANRPVTVLDLYRGRLIAGGILSNNIDDDRNGVTDDASEVDAEMRKLVPFEMLHGQPFDLNRWFGNGIDDNGNGVIDEFQEELAGEMVWPTSSVNQFSSTVNFSYSNDNPIPTDPRQLYARHLFCLAMALMDSNYVLPFTTPNEGTLTAIQRRELTVRRIAQWAINCVDFRDRDSIMTPFEYDANPWNGWNVDGNLGTNEATFASDNIDNDGDGMRDEADERNNLDRRYVWGTEYPDLVLTESFAMHSRGTRDTAHEPGNMGAGVGGQGRYRLDPTSMMFRDLDVDQYRIPQGSLFLELYCARNMANNNAAFPMELYDANGYLDLGRVAPARTIAGNAVRHPVWRVAVIPRPRDWVNGGNPPIHALANSYPASTSFEPSGPYPLNPTNATQTGLGVAIERIVWFAPMTPTSHPEANMVFFGRSGSLVPPASVQAQATSTVTLPPGRYVVAGPRPDTRMGSLRAGTDSDPNTLEESPHALTINFPSFVVNGGAYDVNSPYPGFNPMPSIQPAFGIVCAARPPANWNNQNWLVGMNISEPLSRGGNYYPEPRYTGGRYADLSQPPTPGTMMMPGNQTYDRPFDDDNTNYPGPLTANQAYQKTGTNTDFRALCLQRLANPLLAWNPEPTDPQFGTYYVANLPVNPYITVDWGTSDLTVFTGDEDDDRQLTDKNGAMQWVDPLDENPFNSAPAERFGSRQRGTPPAMGVDDQLWPPRAQATAVQGPPPNDQTGDCDHYFNFRLSHTLGYLNDTIGTPQSPNPAAGYQGTPPTPFPWLTWNNRPFANPMELMLVPASSPSRLMHEFTLMPSGVGVNPFLNVEQYPGHLLNFFHTSNQQSGQNLSNGATQLYRLFDFVETPSHFVGQEKWYYAPTFAYSAAAQPDLLDTFRPPYNRLSRFREPGRPNINTMFDVAEWQAVAAGFQKNSGGGVSSYQNTNHGDFFNNHLVVSRRGFPVANYGDYPTIFANPFRPATSADLMPNITANIAGVGSVSMSKQYGVESTLLRPDPLTPDEPLFDFASGDAYDNTNRNPYFRLRGLNRLSNLVTTHSNVYALWLTVGYFVVEPGPIDAGHPDGYRLGAELGSDRGAIQRHRAFYMIDRSIPVAFEPGQDHNVDRTILLRRYIE